MADSRTIQFDSSIIQAGNTNVAEAIETEDTILFNETYVVVGEKLAANSIHATYDLTIIGDLEANTIEVNGELVVNGNIKASKLRSRRLMCTGKVTVDDLICDEDAYSKSVSANIVQTQGSLFVLDSLVVDEKCEVERNVVTGEGLSGSGILSADSVISGEYFDFDGEINANIFEIETMFKREITDKKVIVEEENFFDKFDGILTTFFDKIVVKGEEEILDELAEIAEIQRVSFSEMYYLFSELVRISKLEGIMNLKDYLIVKYAYSMFPIKLVEYKAIDRAFSMINENDPNELDYTANNIAEFAFSLKILVSICSDEYESYADRIFQFIGLRYNFVNKQFEGREAWDQKKILQEKY